MVVETCYLGLAQYVAVGGIGQRLDPDQRGVANAAFNALRNLFLELVLLLRFSKHSAGPPWRSHSALWGCRTVCIFCRLPMVLPTPVPTNPIHTYGEENTGDERGNGVETAVLVTHVSEMTGKRKDKAV